jgi:hypothetical protein
MEELENQHFDLNLSYLFSHSKKDDIYKSISPKSRVNFLRQKEKKMPLFLIPLLDYACDYPGNLLHYLERFGLSN